MGKTFQPILFTIEPVKPRNRIAVEGRKRYGGPHVKPYGAVRQTHKQALRHLLDAEGDELEDDHAS